MRALHAEQEARAKDHNPSYEPFYTPANLISPGLLAVGMAYSYLAWKQWTAIKEQARIANDSLIISQQAAIGIRRFTVSLEPPW
jgi:hypothetical protein